MHAYPYKIGNGEGGVITFLGVVCDRDGDRLEIEVLAPPNKALRRTAADRRGCNDRFLAPSLPGLARQALIHCMHPQPLICVNDVEASSRWYQRLLNCTSAHGGPNYERLVAAGQLVLQLHRWDVNHHHGPIGDPALRPPGNGLLLWFEINDFDSAVARAKAMGVEVLLPRHRNPPEGDGGPNHWEIWLRDPDGYKVVLASPDGTADGDWRP